MSSRLPFLPPRRVGEDEEGGLNDWNVWNGSAEDVDYGGDPQILVEERVRVLSHPMTSLAAVVLRFLVIHH
jgi:hypothetical protein